MIRGAVTWSVHPGEEESRGHLTTVTISSQEPEERQTLISSLWSPVTGHRECPEVVPGEV